jgi:hypothetical protein
MAHRRVNVNVEPTPIWLWTQIRPLCSSMNFRGQNKSETCPLRLCLRRPLVLILQIWVPGALGKGRTTLIAEFGSGPFVLLAPGTVHAHAPHAGRGFGDDSAGRGQGQIAGLGLQASLSPRLSHLRLCLLEPVRHAHIAVHGRRSG